MTPFETEGTALITGAANGIGRASALALARSGSDLVLIDKDAAALSDLAKEIKTLGRRAFHITADCTDPDAMIAATDQVARDRGPITTLFNNVGQSAREKGGAFAASDEATWRFVLEVSLLTTMRMTRLVLPRMIARGRGRIINMSTDAAFVGDAGLADYAAAKMGVVGFTRSVARESSPHGVSVNAVAPGAIATRAHDTLDPQVLQTIREGIPMGYIGDPDDVANIVVFLASPAARYMTGQTLLIDGGRWMI